MAKKSQKPSPSPGSKDKSVHELACLLEVVESLSSAAGLEEVLQRLCRATAKVMGAKIATIRILEGDELTIGAAYGYKSEEERRHRIKVDEPLRRLTEEQEPWVIPDLLAAGGVPLRRRRRAQREGLRAFLAVPALSSGKTLGVLSVYKGRVTPFSQAEIRLLRAIADQAALAIERARHYEAEKNWSQQLEKKVEEKTRELIRSQEKLIHAERLAATGQLAAGIVHELKNPLSAIKVFTSLVEQRHSEPRFRERFGQVVAPQLERLERLVEELLDLARPRTRNRQAVDVNRLLWEATEVLAPQMQSQKIVLRRSLSPRLPTIMGDKDRLYQGFFNLLKNALEAQPRGGSILVKSRPQPRGLEIIIADRGDGLSPQELDKVFQPFYSTKKGGSGLGLALTARVIEEHLGQIEAQKRKGGGTLFRITLKA